jgi:uncharacterized protein YcfL
MKKLILIFSLLVFGLVSCDSDGPEIVETQAVVLDGGSVAADGCGWLIKIDGVNYSPTYLNTQYQQDGLAVLVTLEYLSTTFTCGLLPTEIPQIRIEQIRPF